MMRVNLDVAEIDILLQVLKLSTFKGEDAPKVANLLAKLDKSLQKGVEKMNGGQMAVPVPESEKGVK